MQVQQRRSARRASLRPGPTAAKASTECPCKDVAERALFHGRCGGRNAKLSQIKKPIVSGGYPCTVTDWRKIMIITWLFKLAELFQYVREGAVIAQRKSPEELKRYLAS